MTTWLKGGCLVDGSGTEPRAGEVLIQGERIVHVGPLERAPEARVFDCSGLAVAPGFIDAHSHSDLQVLEGRPEKALQGVTTEVVGNCGFSTYPAAGDRRELHDFANGILCGGQDWGWKSAGDYLADARRRAPFVNVVSLVGHGSLRIAHAGTRLGPLDETTLAAMERSLDESLAEGAAGFSTGLMYSPGESAPFGELERLCRVVARRGAVHATHMRDFAFKIVESVEEQLELARRTGCRLQIAHFQVVGAANRRRQAEALDLIERAARQGVDVSIDAYPYIAGSTVLTQLLPQWTLEGGPAGLVARLAATATRARIARETVAAMAHQWTDLLIAGVASAANRPVVGQTIQAIADGRGAAPIDAALDLLIEEHGAVNILEFNQSEENLRQTLTHPLTHVVSDGFYVRGKPHPRLHGAFPELLGGVVREKGWMTLAEAVHKITARPAERFRIRDRGRLAPGCFADVTVFDPATVASRATYANPEQPPVGIRYVFRNGRISSQSVMSSVLPSTSTPPAMA